jgi:prepilin-type N-terminal cleavage/methylation domain-containing protein
MWKTKLRASTLIELIMVMVLLGIISSLAFSSLGIFAQNFEFFRKISSRNHEITLLEKLMTKDVFGANFVLSNGTNELQCKNPNHEVKYEFSMDKILRRSENVDTFHLKSNSFNVEYLGNSTEIVDKLSFDILIDDQTIPFVFTKKYAADVFVNQDQ